MKIKTFTKYEIDPMINCWDFHLPYLNVYGIILKLPIKLSIFILTVMYWRKGFNMFKNPSLQILRYSISTIT